MNVQDSYSRALEQGTLVTALPHQMFLSRVAHCTVVQFARIAARRIGKAKTNPLSRGKHNQFETRSPARQKSVAPDRDLMYQKQILSDVFTRGPC